MKSNGNAVTIGAGVGLASALLFITLVAVMGFVHPNYSHLTNFISDLGALDAPTTPNVQRFNFFQFGIGIAVLGWALYLGLENRSRVIFAIQLLIGVGIFLSGIFPGHAGDPASTASMWHNIVGVPAFLLIMVVPALAGRRFAKNAAWRPFARYSMAMTPLLVAWFVLMAWADGSPNGTPGLFQRLFIGTWLVWMMVVAVLLLRTPDRQQG